MTLNEQEILVTQMLAGVWNEYLKLSEEHPMEKQEFCNAIHVCQNIVLSRLGRRIINKERK